MNGFRTALLVGTLGSAAVAAGALSAPRQALAAWLTAAVFVTMIPVGALPLLLVSYLHRGDWSAVMENAMDAAVATMPVAGLIMLPVLFFSGALYPWAWREGEHISPWLEPYQFAGRGLVYIVAWCVLAWLATRRRPPTRDERSRPALASLGLIVYTITATFAGMDWVLSLQPAVYSSIFGMIFISHQMLGAFAFLVLASMWSRGFAETRVRGLGNMLAGGLMLWIYFEYMQYLVAWSGDLPGHTMFFLERAAGAWGWLIYFISIFGAAVPFVLLLWERIRDSAMLLAALAGWLVLMRLAETCWWVMPVVHSGAALPLLLPAALLGAGGTWYAAWLWMRDRRPAASRPARRKEGIHA